MMHLLGSDRGRLRAWLPVALLCSLGLLMAPAAAEASLSWSAPVAVAPHAEGVALSGVACPSTSQCTAIDGRGQEVTFNPQSPAGASSAALSSHTLTGVACPSATECVAVDTGGQEITFNPQAPGTPSRTEIDPSGIPLALACPSTSQCTAVDTDGQEVTFSPLSAAGASPAPVDAGALLVAVACPAADQCSAVDTAGHQVTFDPTSPGTPTPRSTGGNSPVAIACFPGLCAIVDNGGGLVTFGATSQSSTAIDGYGAAATALSGLSCASASECVAVDVKGAEVTFNPSSLTKQSPASVDPGMRLTGVSCPTAAQCTAVDTGGRAVTFDPTSPGTPVPVAVDGDTSLTALSCPSTGQCTAMDIAGSEVTFTPGSTASPSIGMVDPGARGVYSVACPSTTQCTAVDDRGQEVTFAPRSPGTPTPVAVDKGHSLLAVSCPSSTQCTAVDDAGGEVTFNPQAPGTPAASTVHAGYALLALACPSATECVALDSSGAEVTFNPLAPSAPRSAIVDSEPGVSVTCPLSTQCTAVDGAGRAVTFNPATGVARSPLSVDGSTLDAVACRTPTGCVAVDSAGQVVEGDPRGAGGWSSQRIDPGAALTGVACPSALECVAIDTAGDVVVGSSGPLPPVPVALAAPAISGTSLDRRALTEINARWSNAPTSFAYQWERCDAAGRACAVLPGATGQTYVLTPADVGHRIRVLEEAANITGVGGRATSAPTALVQTAVELRGGLLLSGIGARRPRLSFTLTAGAGERPLKRITVWLPRGFAVSSSRAKRARGIVLRARGKRLRFVAQVRGRSLILTLRRPAPLVLVSLGRPAITVSRRVALAARSRRLRAVSLVLAGVETAGPATWIQRRVGIR